MNSVLINLNSVNDVQRFCEIVSKIDADIDAYSFDKKRIVDAKSIVGMMSLDLSQPACVKLHSDDDAIISQFVRNVWEYVPVTKHYVIS